MANFWDRIVVRLTGEHIAILGRRSVGKTTLYDFLETGTVRPDGKGQAATVDVTARGIIRDKRLGLKIKKSPDYPGSPPHMWKEAFKNANIVIYVFNSHLILTDREYCIEVSEDRKLMQDWGTADKEIILLGTHEDIGVEATRMSQSRYRDTVRDHDTIAAFAKISPPPPAIGSLNSNDDAQRLIDAAFRR